MQQRLVVAGGPAASLNLLSIVLARHDLRQKKSIHAVAHDTDRVNALRAAFLEALPGYNMTRLRFVNETSVNLTYCRRYGRRAGVRLHTEATARMVSALIINGLKAVLEPDEALDATVGFPEK